MSRNEATTSNSSEIDLRRRTPPAEGRPGLVLLDGVNLRNRTSYAKQSVRPIFRAT